MSTAFQTSPHTPNAPNRVSLLSVMDEQLAHKLEDEQRKNNSNSSSFPTNAWTQRKSHPQHQMFYETISDDEDEYEEGEALKYEEEMDEDLKRALQESVEESRQHEELLKIIAAQESQISNESNTSEDLELAHKQQFEEDFLYALKIQNELESEQFARQLQEKERLQQQLDPHTKVTYSTHNNNNPIFHTEEDNYDDDEDEDLEQDDEEDEESVAFANLQKQHHEAVKNNGRQTAKEFITKHDLVMDSIRNSKDLERFVPESGNLTNLRLSAPVYNSLRRAAVRQQTQRNRVRGNRLDKATSEQVMDQRTRVMVLKLLNSGTLSQMNGIVSSGKEANVYHAVAGASPDLEGVKLGDELAVKIYKTTLNEFKNRTEYIEGEFRFRHQQRRHNPRKLIKLWAEKETRNLKRLQQAGIPCPLPIFLRHNILVMTFVGKNGFPAPRLRDADLSSSKWKKCYIQLIKIMRQMYQECRLVHADLSEYNVLYKSGQVWIIDMAQSVEYNHPCALQFLKKDCVCISSFLRRQNIDGGIMSAKELFDFVVDINLRDDEVDTYLAKKEEQIIARNNEPVSNEQLIDDAVFLKSFIPRTLSQVPSPLGELFDHDAAYHQAVTGFSNNDTLLYGENVDDEDEEDDDDSSEEEEDQEITEEQELLLQKMNQPIVNPSVSQN